MHFGTVRRIRGQQLSVGPLAGSIVRIRGIGAELIVFDQVPDHIDPEPVDAAVQPKPHHLVHGALDVRIAPIQIRLLFEIRVIIVLARV